MEALIRNKNTESAFHRAIRAHNWLKVQILMDTDDMDAQNGRGQIPIQVIYNTQFPRRISGVFELIQGQHCCCRRKFTDMRYDIIEALLAKSANINHQDEEGCTLLHDAIWYHDWDMADLLLNLGADVSLKNNLQQTPLTLAKPIEKTSMKANFHCLPIHVEDSSEVPLDIAKRLTNGQTADIDFMFSFSARKGSTWWCDYGTEYFMHSLKYLKPCDLNLVKLEQDLEYVNMILKCSLGIRAFTFKRADIMEHLVEAGCSRPKILKLKTCRNDELVADWQGFARNTRSLTQLSQMCVRNSIRDLSEDSFNSLCLPTLLKNYAQLHHVGSA